MCFARVLACAASCGTILSRVPFPFLRGPVKRPRPTIRATTREARRNDYSVRLTTILGQLVYGLAKHLIPAGITPGFFNALANRAFVEAAAEISKCRNGRVNRSRVAVLTSLRRAEVKRLLSEDSATNGASRSYAPRTQSVIAGWLTDRRYTDERGLPRKLPIRGSRSSFASLVKSFAGDVPHRAVLEELHRLGVVRETRGSMELLGSHNILNGSHHRSIRQLVETLLDSLEIASPEKDLKSSLDLHRVTLAANDRLQMTMLRARASSGTSTFLDGLSKSLTVKAGATEKSRANKRKLTVTVLIKEHRTAPYKRTRHDVRN
jgi:uncharacterized protein DUF6502